MVCRFLDALFALVQDALLYEMSKKSGWVLPNKKLDEQEEVMLVLRDKKKHNRRDTIGVGSRSIGARTTRDLGRFSTNEQHSAFCSITTSYAIVPTLSSPFLLLFVAHHARRAPSDPAGSQKRPPFFVHHHHHVGETTL